jgi:TRAP-type C4-dicarboxylate transport system substrate-binding protein
VKKLLILVLAGLLIIAGLALAACGEEETPASSATTAASTETTAASTETTAAPSAEAQVIKLKFACEKPPTHVDMTDNFPGFFNLVEQATNGKYKFEIEWFPVNTILAPADIYDGIVNGIVDAGQSSMAYTPKRFPVILTLSQPGIAPPKSTSAMAKAANELYAKYQPKELADTHLLYLYPSGPGWLHSKKEVTTVDQIKGMRIRVSGVGTEGVKLVGGDPIAMPMADVFEAAQKGTIDALISPAEALEGWKHAELFDFSVLSPYLYASDIFFVTMNKEFFESLPADLQAAIDSVSMEAGLLGGAIWDYAHDHGMKYAEGMGHKKSEWSEAEKAKLVEALKPIRESYIKMLTDLGLPGEEIVTTAVALVEEANKGQYETWAPAAK